MMDAAKVEKIAQGYLQIMLPDMPSSGFTEGVTLRRMLPICSLATAGNFSLWAKSLKRMVDALGLEPRTR
jgi:hypothetical protein